MKIKVPGMMLIYRLTDKLYILNYYTKYEMCFL